jgi:glycerol-3-phosphate dehydrogenase (NAD(P)+)
MAGVRKPPHGVGIIGAGAFGTALAFAALRAGREVVLLTRAGDQSAAIAQSRENPHLPGVSLPEEIAVSADPRALGRADALIVAVPAQALREAMGALAAHWRDGKPVIVAAKGIERSTGRFVSEVVAESLPASPVAVLSGPGFAEDIARGAPTALTLACGDQALGAVLAGALGSPTMRLYHATDVRGVEIGGAAKNVLAIAAGVASGKGFSESTVAALIARSFAELSRFGLAYGAQAETLAGLSGLGDLILTGTSSRSRNRRFGEAVGAGTSVAEAIGAVGLAEGVWTAGILADMASSRGIDMPVATAVADLVAERAGVDSLVERLLSRPQRAE